MANSDFEVHVGFPRDSDALADHIRSSIGGVWKMKQATDSVRPSNCLADPHSVPGSLGKLLTQHVPTIHQALSVADSVLKLCAANPNVRVEVEEVLYVGLEDSDIRVQLHTDFEPHDNSLLNGQLVIDTPPFEIHFGVSEGDGSTFPLATQQLFELAAELEIPVDEAVRFVGDAREKVILTSFVDSFDDLALRTPKLGSRLYAALPSINSEFTMKLVAERIILCAAPNRQSSKEN